MEEAKPTKKAPIIKQFNLNSSLVRRARLIRRKTTNQYSEKLRQLHEKDAIVIYQILVIRLKPRICASDYERACVNASSAQMVPSVDFAYPPMGSHFSEFPPPLFYPDFMKSCVQRKEELEAFRVVLTNEKGDRTFAYCFKFLWNEPIGNRESSADSLHNTGDYSVLVFASHYPHEALFHRLASDFVLNVQKDSSNIYSMCRDLLNLRHTHSEDAYYYAKYEIRELGEYPSSADTNTSHGTQWSRSAVSTTTIQKFGVENTVFIFLNLLAEKRVIVTGANVTEVARAVQSFVRLLAPLEWPHTLIPIVPDSQIELCFNPTPYICGILRYNLNRVKDLLCPMPNEMEEDITVVDLERGVILPCLLPSERSHDGTTTKILLKFASIMIFPKALVVELVQSLRALLPIKNPTKADYKIEKHVMIFYAKMFGHFKRFGEDILSTRCRKRFVQAHPCADTRLFLKWFVENGILQTFIFSQKSEDEVAGQLERRFTEILKKYSPPVDKKGKRRKAKSIMWRIFTR